MAGQLSATERRSPPSSAGPHRRFSPAAQQGEPLRTLREGAEPAAHTPTCATVVMAAGDVSPSPILLTLPRHVSSRRNSGAGHVVHPGAVSFGGRYGGREGFLDNGGHARAGWRPGPGLAFEHRPTAQTQQRLSGRGAGGAEVRALSLGSRGPQGVSCSVIAKPPLLTV